MLCASIKSNKGNAVFAPGFLQEIVDVKFHRALRDIQIPGHFRVGLSCKDQLQDLALSGGELILRRKSVETLLFASDLDGRGQVDPMIQEEKSEDGNSKQHRRAAHQGHRVTGQRDAAICRTCL